MLEYVTVQCPTCWETIELTIDRSAGAATYTEDCVVCCRPMSVSVSEEGEVRVEAE